mmetsp:Transcript_13376/g.32995  ORF Transcript_13376/g.32995 Transcript_13376/m.32995 type:complete len:180 (+) Transcript_13376:11-550(+)
MLAVLALVATVATAATVGRASLLPRLAPCRAGLNASAIAVDAFFADVVVLRNVSGNSPSGNYTYELDLCHGSRTSCGDGVTVCQFDSRPGPPAASRFVAGGAEPHVFYFADSFNAATRFEMMLRTDFLRATVVRFALGGAGAGAAPRIEPHTPCESPNETYTFVATVPCDRFRGCGVKS